MHILNVNGGSVTLMNELQRAFAFEGKNRDCALLLRLPTLDILTHVSLCFLDDMRSSNSVSSFEQSSLALWFIRKD